MPDDESAAGRLTAAALSPTAPVAGEQPSEVTLPEDEPTFAPVRTTERVFHGKVWNVARDTFEYNGDVIAREYVDHTGAVAVLALDDDDRALLIKQYRHPVRMREWEIPAGLLDVDGEDPAEAAARELAEEADIEARELSVLAEFYTSPGGSTEAIRIYLARGLSPLDVAFDRVHEEADMELAWVPLEECVQAVLERRIQNPSLVIAVLAAHTARARGWDTVLPANTPWPRHPSTWAGEADQASSS
jgi:8-oxo-dGTP pyrophosphatase MutT (NUDIX family)